MKLFRNIKSVGKKIKTAARLAIAVTMIGIGVSDVKAQSTVQILTGGTNNIFLATSNNYNVPFSAAYSTKMAIAMSAVGPAGATSNLWFYVDRSVDNITWQTNAITLGAAGNGGFLLAITNIDVGAMPYFRLRSIFNTNTVAFTNVTFSVTTKRGL